MEHSFIKKLGLSEEELGTYTGLTSYGSFENSIESFSPVDGKKIAQIGVTSTSDYEKVIEEAQKAQLIWRKVPAPKRGEIVRQIGNELRNKKEELGQLVAYEMGKSLQEGLGEVQEMIDICDFAVGISRQLYGLTMHSERPQHRMYEQYHPLGIVGIISAFNFPVAVWSWNTALAWVCGNVCVWKPSEKTPLCAIACQKIVAKIFKNNDLPEGISNLIMGDGALGEIISKDSRVALISATGSTVMGKKVAVAVGNRLGKCLLELGGNNAIIITENADLSLAVRAAVFGAIGTAGQRCTTTRRLIIHESIYDAFLEKLVVAYQQLKIGSPLDASNHIGPLIDQHAVQLYLNALSKCENGKATFFIKGKQLNSSEYESGCYVSPSIVAVDKTFPFLKEEVFAPMVYVIKYTDLEEAIAIQNDVPQGLSSSIMTLNMREAEHFLSAEGSDCGIANVNIGTSGAEIGGAFGGEKETGGGRESGSDAWKAYMRRQTNSINYSTTIPLAQGIKFDF